MNKDKKIRVALLGNPNAGKTSLLNVLSGMHLHVGNWPGKTVERKEAHINFNDYNIEIIDLPGTYSLSPYSEEEKISRDFILEEEPDVIVQIIDVNRLEKSLFLFFEALSLNTKIILAFNFNEEARKNFLKIDYENIQKKLGVAIVQIEANSGKNKNELLKAIIKTSQNGPAKAKYLDGLLNLEKKISHGKAISFIKRNISPYLLKIQNKKTKNLDTWFLNSFSAFPVFLFSLFLLFKITFVLANPIISLINNFFDYLDGFVSGFDLTPWLVSFLSKGVLGGLGSLLSFVPLIFILFFLISILEDSGYLARIVVLLDRPFSWFGISGQSFIPMILGFGCNVPAILATRTIKNKKERMLAIFVNPFISCSARFGIYALFARIFFPDNSVLVIMFLYLLGVVVALIATMILSRLIKNKQNEIFIMEMPPYRLPSMRNILKTSWWNTKMFIKKAGTIIFLAIIFIWFLAFFPLGVEYASESSYLGMIGQFLVPIFKPLGFGNWIFSISLLFGFLAKETIIGTLATLSGGFDINSADNLKNLINPLGALSFLVFVSLYVPCLASISVVKSETKSWAFVIVQISVIMIIAWLMSALVYYSGIFLGFN